MMKKLSTLLTAPVLMTAFSAGNVRGSMEDKLNRLMDDALSMDTEISEVAMAPLRGKVTKEMEQALNAQMDEIVLGIESTSNANTSPGLQEEAEKKRLEEERKRQEELTLKLLAEERRLEEERKRREEELTMRFLKEEEEKENFRLLQEMLKREEEQKKKEVSKDIFTPYEALMHGPKVPSQLIELQHGEIKTRTVISFGKHGLDQSALYRGKTNGLPKLPLIHPYHADFTPNLDYTPFVVVDALAQNYFFIQGKMNVLVEKKQEANVKKVEYAEQQECFRWHHYLHSGTKNENITFSYTIWDQEGIKKGSFANQGVHSHGGEGGLIASPSNMYLPKLSPVSNDYVLVHLHYGNKNFWIIHMANQDQFGSGLKYDFLQSPFVDKSNIRFGHLMWWIENHYPAKDSGSFYEGIKKAFAKRK